MATPRVPNQTLPRVILLAVFLALVMTVISRAPALPASHAVALSNGVALTPPMGWNSWYWLQCNIAAGDVERAAYAIATNGMREAGYSYVNVDDCWQGNRAQDGTITADPDRFPDGMKPVVDYIHSLHLKFGIYTDAGSATCMGFPGSLGHEQQDADTYAGWGVDFVKVDWCNSDGLDPRSQYDTMRDALQTASATVRHPMVFSICDWGVDSPWSWGPNIGNMWRTAADIGYGDPRSLWDRLVGTVDQNAGHAAVAHPGAWNDPDALEVGLGWLNDVEDRSQFTLWAMMAAPLLLSNDPGSISSYTKATVTNRDVIAIDQDSAGVQGSVVGQDSTGQLQVWVKPLSTPGTWAVALFNRGSREAEMRTDWRHDLGLASGTAAVRDLWGGSPATTARDGYSARVPGHGVVLLKVTTGAGPAPR
ncbi:MAG TPA: glycoside hydrolase family 27 protein [Dehalococcoidia bacterium]|nr:glycoside hydrolase family 27 protein [Dehalococcoidia bacterium]